MQKRIAFIINPKSGTADKRKLPQMIQEMFNGEWESTIVETEYAGHGKELAARYASEGYDVVVACGGDGTMNEVASALVHTETAFAIVPFGSGNGLARHLGFSMHAREALAQIFNGKDHVIDSGLVNDEHRFFCTCGTGFDAHISQSFSEEGKRGFWTYLKVVLREYLKYKADYYELNGPSFKLKRRAFLITFANAAQWGNMAYIAPHASTRDGLLDVCILSTFPIYSAPFLAFRLFQKTFDRSRHVTSLTSKEVILRRAKEGEFHIDGDPYQMGTEIKVSIDPLSLKVRI